MRFPDRQERRPRSRLQAATPAGIVPPVKRRGGRGNKDGARNGRTAAEGRRAAKARTPARARVVQVGLVQMRCAVEPEVNLAAAVKHVRAAAKRGAEVICLPELFRSR